jgi:hypothetical protein
MGISTAFVLPQKTHQAPSYPDLCETRNEVFQHGEQITYRLYYNWKFVWLPAGEVTFNVRDLGAQYHLSAVGHTVSSFEWFYKVNDQYDTYINKQTLLPSTAVKSIHEGGYQLYEKVVFDQGRYKAKNIRGKTKDETTALDLSLDGCMHDLLSTIYYVRNMDFDNMAQGDRFPVKFLMDKETYPLSVKYVGKKKNKKIKELGRFDTIELVPQLISGDVFKEGAEMKVWASDDKNRVPLLIESPVSVGSVKAVLKSYKGLKYDLSSKLD